MIPLQNTKVAIAIAPQVIKDNASWTPIEVDTAGYDWVTYLIFMGANDIALAALAVQESATSGGSLATITGANFDGGTDVDASTTALFSATDDNTVCRCDIDMTKNGRKRYHKILATNGDGSAGGYLAAIAILSRSDGGALTDTKAGLLHWLKA